MKTLKEIEAKLIENKPLLKHKLGIKEIGIFGSYVRGEEVGDSDLDLLVEFEECEDFGLLRFIEIENELSALLGVKVDLVEKRALKPGIGKRILEEVIYA